MADVKKMATREAYGKALVKLGKVNDDVVVLAAKSCLSIDKDNACLNLTLAKISLSYPASSRSFNAFSLDCNCKDATKSSGVN